MFICVPPSSIQVHCMERRKERFKRKGKGKIFVGILSWLWIQQEQMSSNTRGQMWTGRCLIVYVVVLVVVFVVMRAKFCDESKIWCWCNH